MASVGSLTLQLRGDDSALKAKLAEYASKTQTLTVKLDVQGAGQGTAGITQLHTAITELSNNLSGLIGRQKIVIQEVQKLDPVTSAAARGVGILSAQLATGRTTLEGFNTQGGVLKGVLTGMANSATPLSRELSLTENALKRLQAESNKVNNSGLAQRFRLETAAINTTKHELNAYRIAWQAQNKTDAEAAAYMAGKQRAIQGQITALEAQRAALQSTGVMTAAETKRYQELTAQVNGLSIALRTAASVQAQVNGQILKGSLAAGVQAGVGAQQQMTVALRGTTLETQRLIEAERAGMLNKGQLASALAQQAAAQRGSLAAIEAEAVALRGLGVLDVQQTERLTALTAAQTGYTRAIMATVAAQRAATAAAASQVAAAGRTGYMGGGALNTAAMAASFVSPQLGMAAMAASMGPAIAGMIALGVATAGTARFLVDGADKAAVWGRNMQQLQALTHLGSEEINQFGEYVRDLSTELPINAKHLTELGRQAVLVGLHGSDGMRAYTESMAALGVVLRDVNGQTVSLEKTGQEVVKVLRSTGMTTKEVTDNFSVAIDTLVGLKTAFGVQVPEVTNLAKFWSSYAATVGFTTDQIWAWSAALVSVGARAQGAGGALTKMLEHAAASAAKGGKDLDRWADVLGLTAEQTKELLKTDPSTFLRKFAEGLKRTSDEGTDYSITLEGLHINTAQVVRTAAEMATALPSMDNALRVSAESARDHGLAMRSAKEAADNYRDAQVRLGNAWENFKTKAGTHVIEPLANVVENLTEAVKWTEKLFALFDKPPTEIKRTLKIDWANDSATMMAYKLVAGGVAQVAEVKGAVDGNPVGHGVTELLKAVVSGRLLFSHMQDYAKNSAAGDLQRQLVSNGLLPETTNGKDRQAQFLDVKKNFEEYARVWVEAIQKATAGFAETMTPLTNLKTAAGMNPLTGEGPLSPGQTRVEPLNTLPMNEKTAAFFRAIFGQESGGNYAALNTRTGALGKYQVMPQHLVDDQYTSSRNTRAWLNANWDTIGKPGQGWDYKALGKDVTPREFYNSKEIQEAIAQAQMAANLQKRLLEAGGDLEKAVKEAAKDWYGRGAVAPGEPTPNEYANSVWRRFQGQAQAGAGADTPDKPRTPPTDRAMIDEAKRILSRIDEATKESDLAGKLAAERVLKAFEDGGGDRAKGALELARNELGKLKKDVSDFGQGYDKLKAQMGDAESYFKLNDNAGKYAATLETISKNALAAANAEKAKWGETKKYQALYDLAGDTAAKARQQRESMSREQEQDAKKQEAREKAARALSASVADAARQGDVTLAKQREATLSQMRENDLRAAGESAAAKLAVEQRYAAKQEQAAKAVADLEYRNAMRAAAQGKAQNREQAEKIALGEKTTAYLKAEADARNRVADAQKNATDTGRKNAEESVALSAKLAEETAKRAKEINEQAAKVNEAIRANNIAAAREELTRLQDMRQKDLDGAKDSAAERYRIEKQYADQIYNAKKAVLDKEKADRDIDIGKNGLGSKVQAAQLKTSQATYDNGLAAAANARDKFLSDSDDVLTAATAKFASDTAKAWTDGLIEGLKDKRAGEALSQKAAEWAVNLTRSINDASIAALIKAKQDMEASIQEFGMVATDVNSGETVFTSEDELRGIGQAAQGLTEDYLDLGSAIAEIGDYSRDELEALISQSGIAVDQAERLRTAWADFYKDMQGGPIGLGDNLEGRGVLSNARFDDASQGTLAPGEADNLLGAMIGMDPAELGGILADLVAQGFGESDLARLIRRHMLDSENAIRDSLREFGGMGVDVGTGADTFLSDDQVRGIGQRSDEAQDAFIDLEGVIENAMTLSREELDALLTTAGLLPEQIERVTAAWVDFRRETENTAALDEQLGPVAVGLQGVFDRLGSGALTAGDARVELAGLRSQLEGIGTDAAQNLIRVIDETVSGFDSLGGVSAQVTAALAKLRGEAEQPYDTLIRNLEEMKTKPGAAVLEINQLIAMLERLNEKAAKVEGLNKLKSNIENVGRAVQGVFAMFGQDDIAQGIGELTGAVSSGFEAFAKFTTGDITGGIVASIAVLGQLGKAIDSLDPGLKAWRKGLLDVAAAEKEAMGSRMVGGRNGFLNPFYDALKADAEALTTKANAGFWQRLGWSLFGGAPKTLDEAASEALQESSAMFNEFGSSLYSALENSLMNAFETGDWSGTEAAFEKSLNGLMARMALQAIIATSDLGDRIKELVDARVSAMADGVISPAEQAELDSMAQGISATAKGIRTTWQGIAPTLPGYADGAQEGANGASGGALFGNAPGAQLGIPRLEISLPEIATRGFTDFAGAVPVFSEASSRMLQAANLLLSLDRGRGGPPPLSGLGGLT